MKNLFFAVLFCLSCLPTYAQINCSSVKASAQALAGLYPNLKQIDYINKSARPSGSSISETYTIDWGDNNTTTMSNWFNSTSHSYSVAGTYVIKMTLVVYDAAFGVTCSSSTTNTVVVGGDYCDRLKASISVSAIKGVATLVNNCGPDEPGFSSASYSYNWGDNSSGSTISKGPLNHTYTKSGTYKVRMIFTLSNQYKSCKDTADATVTVTVPTGIQDREVADALFAVYPNPAKDMVNISWARVSDDIANITITDISGKQVMNSTAYMNSATAISINTLQPGLYFVTAKTKDGRATLKLMIQ